MGAPSHFEIEHTVDGQTWTSLIEVQGTVQAGKVTATANLPDPDDSGGGSGGGSGAGSGSGGHTCQYRFHASYA